MLCHASVKKLCGGDSYSVDVIFTCSGQVRNGFVSIANQISGHSNPAIAVINTQFEVLCSRYPIRFLLTKLPVREGLLDSKR